MLVWVDIETTGLDPRVDSILEVGFVMTDDDLHVKATYSVVVRPARRQEPTPGGIVHGMHTESGLLEDCEQIGVDPRLAEKSLRSWLESKIAAEASPMCGSSVHFDRAFLAEQMPSVAEWFAYRNIDISTIKELARRWRPEVVAAEPNPYKRHRVVPDLQDTLALARHYREKFFLLSD